MDACMILADKIVGLIRESGADKVEAQSALSIAGSVLNCADDITLSHATAEAYEEGQREMREALDS